MLDGPIHPSARRRAPCPGPRCSRPSRRSSSPPLSRPERRKGTRALRSSQSGAPGGTPGSHHAYPGGLAQHTAFNTRAALDLEQNYIARYGLKPWRDYNPVHVVAAPILHDIMKLWVFQWTADGSQIPQGKIGAPTTRSHSWTP